MGRRLQWECGSRRSSRPPSHRLVLGSLSRGRVGAREARPPQARHRHRREAWTGAGVHDGGRASIGAAPAEVPRAGTGQRRREEARPTQEMARKPGEVVRQYVPYDIPGCPGAMMATVSGQGSRATASELAETARKDAREAARREELREEERQRAQETLRRKEEERCATWEAQMGDSEASRAVFKAQEELSAMRAAHQAGIVSAGAVVAAVGRLRAAALAAMAQWSRAPTTGPGRC